MVRHSWHHAVGPGLLLVAGACSSSPPPAPSTTPPRVCKTPPANVGFPWFADVTAQYGLAGVTGISVISADVDNDGWSDLITMATDHGQRRRAWGKTFATSF